MYDHLRGDETYKSGWSDNYTYVNSLIQQSNQISAMIKRKTNIICRKLINI